jgi:hypothetical protein
LLSSNCLSVEALTRTVYPFLDKRCYCIEPCDIRQKFEKAF